MTDPRPWYERHDALVTFILFPLGMLTLVLIHPALVLLIIVWYAAATSGRGK